MCSLVVAGCLAVLPLPLPPAVTAHVTLNPSSGAAGTLVLVIVRVSGAPFRCGPRPVHVTWDRAAVGIVLLDSGCATAAPLPVPQRGTGTGPHRVEVSVSGVRGTAVAVFNVLSDRADEPG